jgi:hypothetical protein
MIDIRTLACVICVVLQEWYLDKDCRNKLHLPSTDNPRRIRMGFLLRDSSFAIGGGATTVFCHVSGLHTYNISSYLQIAAFQNFHIEIKAQGFFYNPGDTYISFEEEVLLKKR